MRVSALQLPAASEAATLGILILNGVSQNRLPTDEVKRRAIDGARDPAKGRSGSMTQDIACQGRR